MTKGWHVVEADGALTLSRHLPPRFDLCAETRLPAVRRRALAHEVRKDMWRALRLQRGFAPVVEVTQVDGGVRLRAGGAVAGPVTARAQATLDGLLDSPKHRARWIAHCAVRPC